MLLSSHAAAELYPCLSLVQMKACLLWKSIHLYYFLESVLPSEIKVPCYREHIHLIDTEVRIMIIEITIGEHLKFPNSTKANTFM